MRIPESCRLSSHQMICFAEEKAARRVHITGGLPFYRL